MQFTCKTLLETSCWCCFSTKILVYSLHVNLWLTACGLRFAIYIHISYMYIYAIFAHTPQQRFWKGLRFSVRFNWFLGFLVNFQNLLKTVNLTGNHGLHCTRWRFTGLKHILGVTAAIGTIYTRLMQLLETIIPILCINNK